MATCHSDLPVIVGETHHESAFEHVTGRALYTDDLGGRLTGLLHAYPVQSTNAHAKLKSVDTSGAYAVPGVVRVITAQDIPGVNDQGAKQDEPMLPGDEIMFYGQPIAWVLADTLEAAKEAAAHVVVDVEELPSLVTVQEAIEAESFHGIQPVVAKVTWMPVSNRPPIFSPVNSSSPVKSTST